MRVRITPEMAFYIDVDLQGVSDRTRDADIQLYDKVIYDEFVAKLKKAFSEDDFRIYGIEFTAARESETRAA